MSILKPFAFIGLSLSLYTLFTSCNQAPPSPKATTNPIAVIDKQVKSLEQVLKSPLVVKESSSILGQCAALSFPKKLLKEAISLTRANLFVAKNRTKVSCITIQSENPKGSENLSGDLIVFGSGYPNIQSLVTQLPAGYILNIEQRSEKKPNSIYPWIIKKP
jgi:hypothetical protein